MTFFIENEIKDSINTDTNCLSNVGFLVEMLGVYKLFLQNYDYFQNESENLFSENSSKLELSNQKLFVTTFLYTHISDNYFLNKAIDIFKKHFPSIQFDIE